MSANSTSSVSPSFDGPIPKFDNTLGAILIGGLVAMALWGVTCVQTFNFFMGNSRDKPVFKLLISFLWALDTFDTVLNCHILYFYLVSNYLNPLAITIPVWSVIIHVAITSISNFIIRSMFARRAYRLSGGNILVTLGIVAVSLTDLICGITITVKAFGIGSFLELDVLSSLMYLDFAAGTTSDLSVALVLCYLLRRSRTGFKQTDSLIKILMLYIINTGLIVAIDASLGLVTYIAMPHNFIFLGFYLLLSKLYLNSYLASLNAREGLREKANEPRSIHLSEFQLSSSVHPRFGSHTDRSQSSGPTLTYVGDSEKSTHSHSGVMAISIDTVIDKQVDGCSDPESALSPAHPRPALAV